MKKLIAGLVVLVAVSAIAQETECVTVGNHVTCDNPNGTETEGVIVGNHITFDPPVARVRHPQAQISVSTTLGTTTSHPLMSFDFAGSPQNASWWNALLPHNKTGFIAGYVTAMMDADSYTEANLPPDAEIFGVPSREIVFWYFDFLGIPTVSLAERLDAFYKDPRNSEVSVISAMHTIQGQFKTDSALNSDFKAVHPADTAKH